MFVAFTLFSMGSILIIILCFFCTFGIMTLCHVSQIFFPRQPFCLLFTVAVELKIVIVIDSISS